MAWTHILQVIFATFDSEKVNKAGNVRILIKLRRFFEEKIVTYKTLGFMLLILCVRAFELLYKNNSSF